MLGNAAREGVKMEWSCLPHGTRLEWSGLSCLGVGNRVAASKTAERKWPERGGGVGRKPKKRERLKHAEPTAAMGGGGMPLID